MKNWGIVALAIAIVVVVAAVGAWYAMSTRAHAPTAQVAYAVALTDPPIVPTGTTALTINYSGVAVHTEEQGWIANTSAAGSVDLLALQNLSLFIANVRVPANATVNAVRLYLSNATITVNGSKYPLMLPSGVLKIPIVNATRAADGALVDLQPHVFEAYVGDQPVFVMAPAAVALPLNYTAPPGHMMAVPKELRDRFEGMHANLTITYAALQVVGNETTLKVTVENTGNEAVQVLGVAVKGPWALSVPPLTIQKKDFSARIVVEGARTDMRMVFFANGTQLVPALQMASEHVHAKWFLPPGAKAKEFKVEWEGNESDLQEWMHGFNSNGNGPDNVMMGGPSMGADQSYGSNGLNVFQGIAFADDGFEHALAGYTLQPGQKATFLYEGVIALTPHLEDSSMRSVNITMVPISGDGYSITLLTVPASNATTTTIAG
ncbi:MAG: DUF4382 domain-containing protein [Conexivisphaera sp.]